QNQEPFYSADTLIPRRKVQQFASLLSNRWNTLLPEITKNDTTTVIHSGLKDSLFAFYRSAGIAIIDSIYNPGIIEYLPGKSGESGIMPVILVQKKVIDSKKLRILQISDIASGIWRFIPASLKTNIDTTLICNLIGEILEPNIFYDEETTQSILQTKVDNISRIKGLVRKGDLIISEGDITNEEKYQILISLKDEFETQSGFAFNLQHVAAGQFLLALISVMMIFAFIFTFRKDIYADNRKLFFILLITLSSIFVAFLVLRNYSQWLYIIPFCILPITIRIFYDTRLALFVHLIATLLIGYMAPNGYEFVLLQMIAGFIAIISTYSMRHRSQLFITAGIVLVTYSLTYLAIATIQEGNMYHIKLNTFIMFGFNAFFILFAYPMLYAFEKVFGFLSEVTLLELSDTNTRLLRELAEKAPGTFQHSLQVANLAEEAIYEIGGNTLLARTGALYHDVGKMDMPLYFIENQNTGINPHDEVSFDESARIIISHVERGIEKAKKHNLPDAIIDFIRTHHGTTKVQYFYQSYLNDFPEGEIDETQFIYNGPIPFSKETAVVMMADSVEAASRSLKITTPEAIEELVENIINGQMQQNQFVNADITFRDISRIKKIFKKKLSNIYHVRIEYPK
ncbi:MAG: HDIG domain-containing protein, partial [Bacteroidetes bacterium]|nr:HDIG domain-containing protein [Bacteroidota bacterium]